MVALQTAKYDQLSPGSPGISVGGQQVEGGDASKVKYDFVTRKHF